MRHPRLVVSALATCAILAACSDGTGPGNRVQVRFVNATADVAALDFTVDGRQAAQNVAFGTSSTCTTIDAGAPTFSARVAGSNTLVANAIPNPGLAPASRYTAYAVGAADHPVGHRVLILNDAAVAPGDGFSRLRVINAIPDTLNAVIYVTAPDTLPGVARATNVPFGGGTAFLHLQARQWWVRFARQGAVTNIIYTGEPFDLPAGRVRTMVVVPGETPGTFRTVTAEGC
jgi:hypothetical protein